MTLDELYATLRALEEQSVAIKEQIREEHKSRILGNIEITRSLDNPTNLRTYNNAMRTNTFENKDIYGSTFDAMQSRCLTESDFGMLLFPHAEESVDSFCGDGNGDENTITGNLEPNYSSDENKKQMLDFDTFLKDECEIMTGVEVHGDFLTYSLFKCPNGTILAHSPDMGDAIYIAPDMFYFKRCKARLRQTVPQSRIIRNGDWVGRALERMVE